MNIMNHLTKKHMKTHKKRTIMTILGVIISVAMITAVSTASVTFLDLLQRMAMKDEGAWHVRYTDFPVEKLSQLEHETSSKYVFYSKYLAYGRLKNAQITNEYKPYLYIEKYSTDAMDKMSLELIDGRYPNKENEILLPEHLSNNGGVNYKVGDTIALDLGDRYVEEYNPEYVLNQNNPYNPSDTTSTKETDPSDPLADQESFMVKDTVSFTVVGIMSRPNYEPYSAPGYTAITYLDLNLISQEDSVYAYIFSDHINKNFYDQSRTIAAKYGLSDWNTQFNERVLRYYGISQYDNFNQMTNRLAFILIIIIMVGSISLIYNSFAISITERSKQFGMLASVGATKQQKRNAIFYEGSVIGIIAIPLGIIAGLLGIFITFKIVGPMLTYSIGIEVPLKMKISFTSILAAIIFSIITIFISALIPAKRASRISPIAAIRQSKDISMKKKSLKNSKITKLLFGIEGDLAQKNLKRNRKRYRALVFSLLISLVLFISVGSYTFYVSKGYRMTTERVNYDLAMYIDKAESDDTILDTFTQIDGIKEASKIMNLPLFFEFDKEFIEKHMTIEFLENKKMIYRSRGYSDDEIQSMMDESDNQLNIDILVLDTQSYSSYLSNLKVSTNSLQKESNEKADMGPIEGILINTHQDQVGYSLLEYNVLDLDDPQSIHMYYTPHNADSENNDGNNIMEKEKVEVAIDLLAVTNQLPLGLSYSSMNGAVQIVISEERYVDLLESISYDKDDATYNVYYFANVSKPQGIEDRIKAAFPKYSSSSFYITNRYEEAQQNKQLMMVFSIFVYGFITLISLICMTNLCNTIATSFALRRREFAMLKSVGMTPKSFHRMIRYESLLYGIKSLLYGLPISLFITYEIYGVVNSNFLSKFTFPWTIYLVGILSVFVVVGVAMIYSTFKVKDESIIDGLKSEID